MLFEYFFGRGKGSVADITRRLLLMCAIIIRSTRDTRGVVTKALALRGTFGKHILLYSSSSAAAAAAVRNAEWGKEGRMYFSANLQANLNLIYPYLTLLLSLVF